MLNDKFNPVLTIRPLRPLADRAAPTEISVGAARKMLQQIEGKRAQKAANPQQRHACASDDKYLELLRPYFSAPGTGAIASQKIIAAVDTNLRQQGYDYTLHRHAPATGNRFYVQGRAQVYDLAGYHVSSSRARRSHHELAGQKSVFYLRCEEPDPETLFVGNLQIDDKWARGWKNPGIGALLLRRPNIARRLIYEGLRHAALSEKKNILFASGAANARMQAAAVSVTGVKITPQNFAAYSAAHHARKMRYAAMRPGACLGITEDGRSELILLEKFPERQILWRRDILQRQMTAGLLSLIYYRDALHNKYHIKVPAGCPELIEAGWRAAQQGRLAEVAASLRRIFPGHASFQPEQLGEYLAAGATNLTLADYMEIIQRYLKHSGAAARFLSEHPELREYEIPSAHYLAPALEPGIRVYPLSYLTPPRLGRIYYSADGDSDYLNEQAARMCQWYEEDVPALVREFGLQVEKTSVDTGGGEFPVWKIFGNWERFATMPLVVF